VSSPLHFSNKAWQCALRVAVAPLLVVSFLSCEGVTPIEGGGGDGTWLERVELSRADGIVKERVAYRSGNLKIFAEICRPDDDLKHAVVLWNHGGFEGLFDADRQACTELAKNGLIFAASYYRGEGGSDGEVEACLGEVDDVESLLDEVKGQPYAKEGSVAVIGASHGGCITLDLAIRRPELKAAVDFSGPGDWAELYNWWADQVERGEPVCARTGEKGCAQAHLDLMRRLRESLGGTPEQVPAAYAARSPILRLDRLEVPTLITQGTDDVTIPYEQGCMKRAALDAAGKSPAAWYLDESLIERTDRAECGDTFRQANVLLAATQKYAFVIYAGQGHYVEEETLDNVIALAVSFVLAHI